MTTHVFLPEWKLLTQIFNEPITTEALSQETGFYAADEHFALKHGGPVTQHIIANIPKQYKQDAYEKGKTLNIDVRIHHLKQGQYPASPGWHCDAAQREISFNANGPVFDVERSLVLTLSTHPQGVSRTLFLCDELEIESDQKAGSFELWAEVDKHIRSIWPLPAQSIPDGYLTEFTSNALHTATPAVVNGSRLFVRISQWVAPPGHRPGLTKTEQIYERIII